MKKFARIIAIILLAGMLLGIILPNIIASAADINADLWVDPVNGKDSNNGTTAQTALKTIQAAKSKAATLSASGDVVVILKGGVYDATTPIVFGSSDSGKNGNAITYRAAEGEEVLISGGQKLTDWTLYDAGKNIYVADIPTSAKLTRQFYVDNEPQPMARLENSPTDWEEVTSGFNVPAKYNLKDLWHPAYVEFHTLYLWYHRIEHFTGINSDGTKIYEDTNCIPTWVANDYLFIDRAGEWYIDRDTHKIYYKADGTMDGKEAYLPVTEQVIQMDYASNITFEGITFSHTSYTHTSENRYLDQQANGHYYDGAWHQVPGGIRLTGCTGITFDSCDIRNMGTAGIQIRSDKKKMSDCNSILNCRIYDISYSGIIVAEVFAHHGYQSYQLVKNTTIKNNLITRIGIDMFDSPGIVATYTNGTIIDHNEISYCPYSGISLGWGWSNEEKDNNVAFMNEVGNNQVTNNYIHDVCKTNYDGGAFYSLGMSKGTVVSGNYIYNSGNGASRGEISIYLDEGSSYMEIFNNVVGGQSSYWAQMFYPNIHDNYWHDNYYDSSIPSRANGRNNTVVNNTAVSNSNFTQYSGAMEIINNAGLLDESLKDGMWEGFVQQHDIIQAFYSGMDDRYIKPTAGWDNVSVPNQVGRTVYDSINGTISIIVDGDADITALPLTFDLFEGWTCDKTSGSAQDFTNPVTYMLKYGSNTVRWVITVNQQIDSSEEIEGTEVDLKNIFTSGSNWTSAPSSVSGGVMTHGTYSVYTGQKFAQDSIFEFDLSIPINATSEWVAFVIKAQKPGTMCINGGTEYYVGFNADDVEVQKFVNGQRTVIFGEVSGFDPTYGVLPNNFFTPGSFHSIRVGAINVTGGVRFFMYVDGNLVFDITDFSNPITNDGYFGVYGMTKSISLRGFTDIQNTPDTTDLDAAIAASKKVKATDYTVESYRALQTAMAQADEILSAYGGVTQAMADEACGVLTAALNNLEKVQGGQIPTEPTAPATQPTTAPTQPKPTVFGDWLDMIPESSITPHVGDYLNGDLSTLKNEDSGEAAYLSDAHVGTAGWIGTKGQASNKIQAVLYELNGTKTVGGVELTARDGDYVTEFDIEVKDTNGVWQKVKQVTGNPFTDSYTAMFTFDPVVGTEVRILVYDYVGSSNDYPMLMEVSVYEVKTGTVLQKVPVTSVTANKSPNPSRHTVDKIFDGDKKEGIFAVSSGSLPVRIEANLTDADGNPSNICRLKLFAYDDERYTAKGITVEVQTTKGGAWTHVYTGNAYSLGFEDTFVLDFDQAYDAYALRLTVNSTISDYLIVPEVELYGYLRGEAPEEPPVDPTVPTEPSVPTQPTEPEIPTVPTQPTEPAAAPTIITKQPATSYITNGTTATLAVEATGTGLTYQWQSSTNGTTWSNCSSENAVKATFTFTGKTRHNGNYYRCEITNVEGDKVYTDIVRLYVLGVTTQPKAQQVKAGTAVKLTVKATGNALTYKWQSSTDGKTWKNCSSSSSVKATFTFTGKTSHNGNYYRCKVTDSAGNTVYTDAVRLYVLGITTQPKTQKVEAGAAVKFTVKATGKGLKYQWQSSADGKTWKNCSSTTAKNATFTFTGKTSHNGNYYRCKITDSTGKVIYSDSIRLYVLGVTTQPKTQKVAAGATVKFVVKATGTGLTYQWQSSADGKTWKNCSSSTAKNATFTFTGKSRHNGNYYRCKVTDSAGNVVYTNTANLKVTV